MPVDTSTIEMQSLRATLDRFSVGVAIVGEEGRILHVNEAARSMLDDGATIRTVNGRLTGACREATRELLRAIGVALRYDSVTGPGATGIGVPLPGSDGSLAAAHVVPLARSKAGPVPTQAAAAVFFSHAGSRAQPDLTVIAQCYRLTPAEGRLLARLLVGETLVEAAELLGIRESTARTHLSNLLAKTGTLRQADLITLVYRLIPPVSPVATAAATDGHRHPEGSRPTDRVCSSDAIGKRCERGMHGARLPASLMTIR
jgi:DNA-binding CsgD family transcriptional regulator